MIGKKVRPLLIALLLSGICGFSFGQVRDDLAFIVGSHAPPKKIDPGAFRRALGSGSDLKAAMVGLVRVYQLFISSQDRSVCNFTLSCSRFSLNAVQKYGIVYGLLMASDRIQRCNGIGRKYYPQDPKTSLSIDFPTDMYYLGRVEK